MTYRIYEITLLDRTYMEYAAFGGLAFINRLVLQGLQRKDTGIQVAIDTEASDRIRLSISYSHPMIPKKIVLVLDLLSVRRTTATEDVEVLGRRVRELEALLAEGIAPLTRRIKELEQMGGGMVLLPGGGPPCPEDTTLVEFAITDTKSIRTLTTLTNTVNIPSFGQVKTPTKNCTQGQYIIAYDGVIPLKSIVQVQHLKKCTTLCLAGFNDSPDFSFISEMKQLSYLYITCQISGTANTQDSHNSGRNPSLKDISWITNLKNLHQVSFFGCTQLVDITPLKELKHLKHLDIRFTGVKNTECLVNPGLTITK